MSQEFEALANRVHELERQARRYRRGALAVGLALAGVMLAAAAPVVCDIVTGERLVLRDETGRTRVTLDAYRTDAPALAFQDRDGRVRARLGLDAAGEASISVYDAQGKLAHVQRFAPPVADSGAGGGTGAARPATKKPAADPATTTATR